MNLQVVALNDSESDVRAFLKKEGLQLPVLLDGPGEIAAAYGISAVPTAVFIDPQGNIGNTKIGGTTVDDLVALVDSVR
ncbi:MAG: TlpA family protein disulfide reductase [Thermoleophilia bacterium]|nr:TlpA family protein disulfide reductase [Thermoleophilia bacterium]